MLQRVDRFLPYLAVMAIGYLTYSTSENAGLKLAEGRELPQITDRMLETKFIEPETHASPIERDPFEVNWASYMAKFVGPAPATRPASQPASQPATSPAARHEAPPKFKPLPAPALPGKLVAVMVGPDFRSAIIGGRLYEVGSPIGGKDPNRCWRVEAIEENGVTIRFADHRRGLTLNTAGGAASRPAQEHRRVPHE